MPSREKKKIQVMIAIRKDLRDKIMVDHRTNFSHYIYFMLLKIQKLNLQLKKPGRKTQVVNIYGYRLGKNYI